MKKKLGLLFVVVTLALSSLGMSYAGDSFTAFVGFGTWDNDDNGKNVGSVTAQIVNPSNLTITVYNAYSGYVAKVNFTIKHIGEPGESPRVYLDSLKVFHPHAVSIIVTDLSGDPIPMDIPLDPGETLEGLVTIKILNIKEDKTYTFGINIAFRYPEPA